MTINCKGELIDLSTPKVMGILNTTPDSFYDGGKFSNDAELLKQVESMLVDGATFIDIGGYSSRPGANDVTEDEELKRVLPAISSIINTFPDTVISIDTFRSEVAKQSIAAGASLVNDISGGQLDEKMFKTIGDLQVPYIMMHMRGNPKTMQSLSDYSNITRDLILYFSSRIKQAQEHKMIDIIIDPGFGFSKTTNQNYKLLKELQLLKELDKPILAGVSRKSMIYKVLKTDAEHALNGTTALHMMALNSGASILRAHDVREAVECISLFNHLNAQ